MNSFRVAVDACYANHYFGFGHFGKRISNQKRNKFQIDPFYFDFICLPSSTKSPIASWTRWWGTSTTHVSVAVTHERIHKVKLIIYIVSCFICLHRFGWMRRTGTRTSASSPGTGIGDVVDTHRPKPNRHRTSNHLFMPTTMLFIGRRFWFLLPSLRRCVAPSILLFFCMLFVLNGVYFG